jgi:hypothetical protein
MSTLQNAPAQVVNRRDLERQIAKKWMEKSLAESNVRFLEAEIFLLQDQLKRINQE